MNDIYNKEYLEDLLFLLDANIKDFENWSVHNNDHSLEEIQGLRYTYNQIAQNLEREGVENG